MNRGKPDKYFDEKLKNNACQLWHFGESIYYYICLCFIFLFMSWCFYELWQSYFPINFLAMIDSQINILLSNSTNFVCFSRYLFVDGHCDKCSQICIDDIDET